MGRGHDPPARTQQRRQPSVPVVMVTSGVCAVLAAGLAAGFLQPDWPERETGAVQALPQGFPQMEWEPPGATSGQVTMGLPRLDTVPASAAPTSAKPGPGGPWLSYLNDIRAAAGAPPVTENGPLSQAVGAHVAWMVAAGKVSLSETPGKPGFTQAADTAARRSLVLAGASDPTSAIRSWLESPFHAAALTDASLRTVGWGYAQGFAALDVVSGRADAPPASGWPRTYPRGPGAYPLRARAGIPDPSAGCPQSSAYGAPIVVDFGPGAEVKGATAALRTSQEDVPVCVRSAAAYSTASWALGGTKVVVLPLAPLKEGARYQGTVTSVRGVAPLDFTTGRGDIVLGWHPAQPRTLTPGVSTTLRATVDTPQTTAPVTAPLEVWAREGDQWRRLAFTSVTTSSGKAVSSLTITVPTSGDVVLTSRGSFAVRAGYSPALTVQAGAASS